MAPALRRARHGVIRRPSLDEECLDNHRPLSRRPSINPPLHRYICDRRHSTTRTAPVSLGDMASLLDDFGAFLQEHRRCGQLDGGRGSHDLDRTASVVRSSRGRSGKPLRLPVDAIDDDAKSTRSGFPDPVEEIARQGMWWRISAGSASPPADWHRRGHRGSGGGHGAASRSRAVQSRAGRGRRHD